MTIDQITTMLAHPGFRISSCDGMHVLDCSDTFECTGCIFSTVEAYCAIIYDDQITNEQLVELRILHPEHFI
jgi:hypothetical protein